MPYVFVHGNPEVDAIWNPLVDALTARGIDDIVLLSPPGFGAPAPDDLDATMSSYVDWLVGEVTQLDGPIHLVGHDWGAGHVLGLVNRRPDLVTTWATDIVGIVHPDYRWHDAAQAWQTPSVGEETIDAMVGLTADERTAAFAALDLPTEIAAAMAHGVDATMGRCILALYRSATTQALTDLGAALSSTTLPRGLGIVATADPYVDADLCSNMTAQVGAAEFRLDGAGHWWMVEQPDAAATGLIAFWSAAG